eukprot:m.143146 g.143146  ORF g.143146 m.143146 type:complete len:122 (-) comp11592_c0_seq13:677-1042(-)
MMATAHPWFHPLFGAYCMIRWQTRRVLPSFNSPSIAVWLLTANTSSGLLLSSWTKLTGTKRRRVRGNKISGDAPTVLGAPPTDLHLHEFSCGIRARFESVWWVGVNGVNGLCCAVVWRDGG